MSLLSPKVGSFSSALKDCATFPFNEELSKAAHLHFFVLLRSSFVASGVLVVALLLLVALRAGNAALLQAKGSKKLQNLTMKSAT